MISLTKNGKATWAVALSLVLLVTLTAPCLAWKSSRLGVSFIPPRGWKQIEDEQHEATFIAPEEVGHRSIISLKVVELEEAEPEGKMADELSDKYMAALQQRFTHFKLIGETDTKVNGYWCHRLTFRAQEEEYHMQMTNILFIKGKKAYSFLYMSKPDTYNNHIKEFDKMIKTVNFI